MIELLIIAELLRTLNLVLSIAQELIRWKKMSAKPKELCARCSDNHLISS